MTPALAGFGYCFRVPRPKLKAPEPEVPTRYPLDAVRAEIEALDDPETGIGYGWHKQAAPALGMTEPDFSKHLNAPNSRRFFDVVELGRLAAWVSLNHFTVPPGWPLVTRDEWDEKVRAAVRQARGIGSKRP